MSNLFIGITSSVNAGTVSFSDDFSVLNQDNWYVTRINYDWLYSTSPDYAAVTINNGALSIYEDRTDDGPVVFGKPIQLMGGNLTIKRTLLIHPASDNFDGVLDIYESDSSLSSTVGKPLCEVYYANETYDIPRIGFYLYNGGGISGLSSPLVPIWDTWFNEEFRYDAATGLASYTVNGQTITHQCAASTSEYVKIRMHSYGWFTGHYTDIDSMSIEYTGISSTTTTTTPTDTTTTTTTPTDTTTTTTTTPTDTTTTSDNSVSYPTNKVYEVLEKIAEGRLAEAGSGLPMMLGYLANHPYFKNTLFTEISSVGAKQLGEEITKKFTSINVKGMARDYVAGIAIDFISDKIGERTNSRWAGGAIWFAMKQLYGIGMAYHETKGYPPLFGVALLSAQFSLLADVIVNDIKEFKTLEKEVGGAKAAEVYARISNARVRNGELFSRYQDYFRADNWDAKNKILADIISRQKELLKGYLTNKGWILSPNIKEIANEVFTTWKSELPGNLLKEEFEVKASINALVYEGKYDTARNISNSFFGVTTFADDAIKNSR